MTNFGNFTTGYKELLNKIQHVYIVKSKDKYRKVTVFTNKDKKSSLKFMNKLLTFYLNNGLYYPGVTPASCDFVLGYTKNIPVLNKKYFKHKYNWNRYHTNFKNKKI